MGDRAELLETMRTAAGGLSDVTEMTMFGCEALFAKGHLFALVWKAGRVAVKITDPTRLSVLAAMPGSDPWMVGPRLMKQWVLVPPELETTSMLAPWLKEAHALARALPRKTKTAPKTKPKPKKTPADASAKKKTASTRR